jgi:hypothetical protein
MAQTAQESKMRGLEEIRKTNENPHGFHGEEQFGTFHPDHPRHTTPEETQRKHGERVEARKRLNGPFEDDILSALGLTERDQLSPELRLLNNILGPSRPARRPGKDIVNDLLGAIIAGDLISTIVAADKRQREPGFMDRLDTSAMFEEPPFVKFWQKLNDQLKAAGKPEAGFSMAREAFLGGPTPVGAMTFVGKEWDGVRAVPATPVAYLGGTRPAYHGEYRSVTDDGTKWLKVVNKHDQPISYALPEAALIAAKDQRNETVPPKNR